jgi:hypothetical protein
MNLFKHSKIHYTDPWVGYICFQNTVESLNQDGQVIIKQTVFSYYLLIFNLALMAVYALIAYTGWNNYFASIFNLGSPIEKFATALIGFIPASLIISSIWSFLKLFIWRGSIVVDRVGLMRFYRSGLEYTNQQIKSEEISDLKIKSVFVREWISIRSSLTQYDYLLILELKVGEPRVLCVSTNEALLRTIRKRIIAKMRLNIESPQAKDDKN